jgi:phosphinothricin acetyltransferase
VHRSVGFTEVGVLRSCGWKFERWLDVVMMEMTLGAGDKRPPE